MTPRVLWKVSRLDVTWPSVRVRAMTPALLLRREGYDVRLVDTVPGSAEIQASDVVIISKSFAEDDLTLATRARELGKALIIDLCDDVFIEGREASAESFRGQAALADLVLTTGGALAATIKRQIGNPAKLRVIPDHTETLALTRELVAEFPPDDARQRERVFGPGPLRRLINVVTRRERPLSPDRHTIVWFGMAGLAGQGTGIEALAAIAPQLNAVARDIPIQLLIVSTAHGRVSRLAKAFALPWAFRDWRLLSVYEHVATAQVCVIPNPATGYAEAKSPNRAMLALSAGTPVVASASPAYAEFAGAIQFDDFEAGVRRYLCDRGAAQTDVAAARNVIERIYRPDVIVRHWARAISDVASQLR